MNYLNQSEVKFALFLIMIELICNNYYKYNNSLARRRTSSDIRRETIEAQPSFVKQKSDLDKQAATFIENETKDPKTFFATDQWLKF